MVEVTRYGNDGDGREALAVGIDGLVRSKQKGDGVDTLVAASGDPGDPGQIKEKVKQWNAEYKVFECGMPLS